LDCSFFAVVASCPEELDEMQMPPFIELSSSLKLGDANAAEGAAKSAKLAACTARFREFESELAVDQIAWQSIHDKFKTSEAVEHERLVTTLKDWASVSP